jgi:hypothetical protein
MCTRCVDNLVCDLKSFDNMIEAPFGKIKLKKNCLLKSIIFFFIIISFFKDIIETNILFHIESIKAYFKSFHLFLMCHVLKRGMHINLVYLVWTKKSSINIYTLSTNKLVEGKVTLTLH